MPLSSAFTLNIYYERPLPQFSHCPPSPLCSFITVLSPNKVVASLLYFRLGIKLQISQGISSLNIMPGTEQAPVNMF